MSDTLHDRIRATVALRREVTTGHERLLMALCDHADRILGNIAWLRGKGRDKAPSESDLAMADWLERDLAEAWGVSRP